MGEFIEVSAVRHDRPEQVADLTVAYAAKRGVRGQVEGSVGPDYGGVEVFPAHAGWTVLAWPTIGLGVAADVSQAVSAQLGTVASSVSVYDGDVWIHFLHDSGHERDRFMSVPDYWESDPDKAAALIDRWTGDPATVAATVGVSEAEIAPYLTPLTREDLDGSERRAHPDDRSTLADVWVFVDFWRRLGITYPDMATPRACTVTMEPGWDTRL